MIRRRDVLRAGGKQRRGSGVAALLLALTAAACGDAGAGVGGAAPGGAAPGDAVVARAGELTITHAAAPAPIGDRPGALYFTVHNAGSAADTLVALASPAAGSVTLHDQAARGGSMVMTPVPALAIPAGGTARLAPGGLHAMLEQRQGTLAAGDTLRATLTFARAGAVEIAVPVVSYAELEERVGGRETSAHAGH